MLILPLRRWTENREVRGVGKKRTEITIETERILFISRRSNSYIFWCDRCARRVPALTLEEAAAVTRGKVYEILQKIEEEQIHCVHAPVSSLRICSNSLLK